MTRNENKQLSLGIDVGSTTVKVVLLEGEEILQVRLSILRSWGADAAGVYGAAFW